MTAAQPVVPMVTADFVTRLLLAHDRGAGGDEDKIAAAAASPRHKLEAVLLSCRRQEGHPLTRAQLATLALHERRLARYRAAWKLIQRQAPSAYQVKGSEIASHYPPGVIRGSGDLDVICPATAELWDAAAALRRRGWDFGALTIMPPHPATSAATSKPWRRHLATDPAGDCEVLLHLESTQGDDPPCHLDFSSVAVSTSARLPPRHITDPFSSPAATSLVVLVAERYERRFTTRDVLDAALLGASLGTEGTASLRNALTETRLWPEWAELARSVARCRMLPALPRGERRGIAPWQRVSRAADVARRWGHPTRAAGYLMLGTVDEERNAMWERFAYTAGRRVSAQRLLELGVPLFAVPLDDSVQTPALSFSPHDRQLCCTTPLGSFLLVASACPEADIDKARGALRRTAGPAASTSGGHGHDV
jgi:hypothetical protein